MEAPSADMKAGKLDEILNCFVTRNFHHILRQSYHYDHCQHSCSHLLIEITETINNCIQIFDITGKLAEKGGHMAQ